MAPPPPPPKPVISPLVALIIRLITLVALIISIIILATNTITTAVVTTVGTFLVKSKFSDYHAYRYMMGVGVIGMVYTLLQAALTVYFVTAKNHIAGNAQLLVDFYADKTLSYLLATGAAAGFGLTVDARSMTTDSDMESFLNKILAAASMLFIGFLFSATSSIFSSLSLTKTP